MNQVNNLSKVTHIIAVASGKGGVGKSTIATNLAYALNRQGHKVGLMDADIYGPSQPGLLGSSAHPVGQDGFIVPLDRDGIKFISMGAMTQGKSPVIMRAPMAVKAISQFLTGVLWGELDFLLIDMPPGTGDIQLSIAQQIKLAGVIIVTTPQRMAAQIAKLGLQMFEILNAPIIGVVENMSGFTCGHCHEVTAPFKKGGGSQLAADMKVPFLGEVPLDPNIMMSADDGLNLQSIDDGPHASGQVFMQLALKMKEELKLALVKSTQTEPEKIEHDETLVRIKWKDGSSSEIDSYSLRLQCPCALCVDENSGQRILRPEDVPLSIRALAVRPVGRYGVMVDFSDGHNKGIYRFSLLRELSDKKQNRSMEL